MKIVITGGHHSSALPVIKLLIQAYPEIEVYWFGHKYSALGDKNPTLEYKEITSLGIPFFDIKAGKFYKTLNVKRLAKIPFGFFQCLYLLIKIRPKAILSFGGYLAAPCVLAGWFLKIPAVTHEQTVVAGWANRLISTFSHKVMISWEQSRKYFPKDKTIFVGLPLREEIFEVKSDSFNSKNNLPTVYITTGKIGSHIINTMVAGCLEELLGFCNVVHQCGDNSVFNDYVRLDKIYKSLVSKVSGTYYLRKFILENEIGEAYARSSLVIARSGAHTTAELAVLKKLCVLVPIPWVSYNEQFENAKILENAGLAYILEEKNLSEKVFVDSVKKGLTRKVNQEKLGRLHIPVDKSPAQLIVQNLLSIAK